MKYYDFKLNIPLDLLTTKQPDQFIDVYYREDRGEVFLEEFGVDPEVAKLITNWELLGNIAFQCALEESIERANEKMDFVNELKKVLA